jgi:hypothetical protein
MLSWVYLGVGILAGLAPARWFWGRGMQFLDGTQLRSRLALVPVDSQRRRRWWKSPAIWADPLRGGVSGWIFGKGIWQNAEGLGQTGYNLAFYGAFVVVGGFVLWQSLGRLKEKELVGPILFLGGLLAGFWGWVPGMCALAVGILTLLALQSVDAAFLAMAATMATAGWLLIGFGVAWLAGVGICGLPVALAFLLRYRLVLPVRG